MKFVCNICGSEQEAEVFGRETVTCKKCSSTSRYRAVVNCLAMELFGKSLILEHFPEDKRCISGIGLSDWDGYAKPLSRKLDYKNTYYHKAPFLDIRNIPIEAKGRYDFLISSDVLEHVPPPVSIAFRNSFEVLKPGGVMVFTVPYTDGPTIEHFPELHDFKIKRKMLVGKKKLVNRTNDGCIQTFENLVFHGGQGSTLEMRRFGKQDLLDEMESAGFTDIKIYNESYPQYGIIWDNGRQNSFAFTARRKQENNSPK